MCIFIFLKKIVFQTSRLNLEETQKRTRHLRTVMNVVEIWECEINEMLKKDKYMKNFFEDCPDIGPIDPREAFTGGRTAPLALYAKADDMTSISMADVVSLYPFVNYAKDYPVDIPEIIYPKNIFQRWTNEKDISHKGLFKVLFVLSFLYLFLCACFTASEIAFTSITFKSAWQIIISSL